MRNSLPTTLNPEGFEQKLIGSNLLGLYQYWRSIHREGISPQRIDFDPLDIHRLLPHIYLCEIQKDGRYFFRTAGTATRALFNVELSGKYLEEIPEVLVVTRAMRSYKIIRDTKKPWLSNVTFTFEMSPDYHYARLTLPLTNDQGIVTHLLGGIELDDPTGFNRPFHSIQDDKFYFEKSRNEYLCEI